MREVQIKLMRGLLDLVILQFLRVHPMHGYQIITHIRKNFGVYFGPSTVYPLLGLLEEKGYIKGAWDLNNDRPRKVYTLTNEGLNLLDFTEAYLKQILQKISNISVCLQVERLCKTGFGLRVYLLALPPLSRVCKCPTN